MIVTRLGKTLANSRSALLSGGHGQVLADTHTDLTLRSVLLDSGGRSHIGVIVHELIELRSALFLVSGHSSTVISQSVAVRSSSSWWVELQILLVHVELESRWCGCLEKRCSWIFINC